MNFYSKPTFTSSTWALLAITRFLLAFIVMVSFGHLDRFTHLGTFFNVTREFGGKTAVMVFLMISGISVGYSIMKSDVGFLKRRFLRIYPLYFIAVLFAIFLQYYLGSPYPVRDGAFVAAGYLTTFSNFLLLQGIASLTIMYDIPLWSISVEFFLYLMLPLLFKMRLSYIYLIALISIIIYIVSTHLFSSISLYGIQHVMYAWPFIIGFLIAVKKQFWSTIPLILVGTFGMYYNFLMEVVLEKFAFVFFLITVITVIYFMYSKTDLSNYIKIIFNFLGNISYPMYLFHIPFYMVLYHIGIRDDYALVSLAILLCIPINYIFDVWLKKIFWKPLMAKIESVCSLLFLKRTQNKPAKV